MKAELNTKEKPQFEPIKITITIESEEELCDLYHRINIGTGSLESVDYEPLNSLKYGFSSNALNLFNVLDDLIHSRNLITKED